MKAAFQNFSITIAALLVGALVLEIILRFFITLPSPLIMSPRSLVMDQRGFWVFDPGLKMVMDNYTDFSGKTVTIGANGLRHTPCRSGPPTESENRVFIIGDSQTFGFGLTDEEAWPNRLQCLLRQTRPAIKIHNLGVPGINTDQYFMRLSQIWRHLTARDHVVVVLTWNDLATSQNRFPIEKIGIRHCPAGSRRQPHPEFPLCLVEPKRHLGPETTWRLKLYQSIGLLIPSFDGIKAFADTLPLASAIAFVTVPRLKILWYSWRGKTALFDKLPKGSFADNMKIVAHMRDLVTQKGASFETILLPNRVFADDYYYRAYSKGGTVFTERDFPKHATAAACRTHKLSCFSLLDALQTSERDRYTFSYDGHLNPAGANAVARALAARLQKSLLPR